MSRPGDDVDPRAAAGAGEHGWTPGAVKAFHDRSVALDDLRKAEQALAFARATLRQSQRAYEREIDAMVAARTLQPEPRS